VGIKWNAASGMGSDAVTTEAVPMYALKNCAKAANRAGSCGSVSDRSARRPTALVFRI